MCVHSLVIWKYPCALHTNCAVFSVVVSFYNIELRLARTIFVRLYWIFVVIFFGLFVFFHLLFICLTNKISANKASNVCLNNLPSLLQNEQIDIYIYVCRTDTFVYIHIFIHIYEILLLYVCMCFASVIICFAKRWIYFLGIVLPIATYTVIPYP